jgi:ABC transport system ATP-binding/permease protein
MSTTRNLVNLSQVSKGFAAREILTDVTLGIAEGDRIGVVGANGQGKSTLLDLIAGIEQPDSGQVTRLGTLRLAVLDQGDDLDPDETVRGVLLGDRAEHEWAADRVFRGVLNGLLGGVEFSRFADGVETRVRALSGGERRRIALARVLLDHPDLLLLDEPTNHLDVEVISWLAGHLAARSGAMLIVTHDRWFLDEVCTNTWEVSDGTIHQYEGGYAAYVLARAERDRQASARDDKRRQLVRKELAWLRRGPPARTAKPKFRIEAANALIADEPVARDTTELLRFANSRLGNKVINVENVSYAYDGQRVINDVTWRLGPGERLALVGANGSGKSTLMGLMAAELTPAAGHVDRGETVKLAHLSQSATEIPEHLNVLAAVEEIRKRSTLADGSELTAGKLAERFGFRGEKSRTLVRDLSGGERRRLVLMRLLMSEPNVLLLDEPTNDLDIDTLNALEDLLDQWPGTLLVISHDRYFIERVCDNVFALTHSGGIRHLPGGIDQYITELGSSSATGAGAGQARSGARKSGKETREARKEAQRLERELERKTAREQELQGLMAASSSDHARLSELSAELRSVSAERERLETAWLEAAETLDA